MARMDLSSSPVSWPSLPWCSAALAWCYSMFGAGSAAVSQPRQLLKNWMRKNRHGSRTDCLRSRGWMSRPRRRRTPPPPARRPAACRSTSAAARPPSRRTWPRRTRCCSRRCPWPRTLPPGPSSGTPVPTPPAAAAAPSSRRPARRGARSSRRPSRRGRRRGRETNDIGTSPMLKPLPLLIRQLCRGGGLSVSSTLAASSLASPQTFQSPEGLGARVL
mmetsp:Transcript_107513/g.342812  ORF Transcript_107513/g.342812 Transcript_107513/m.342812 type:complete len:218 (-) Transcript_107513:210-863(-)